MTLATDLYLRLSTEESLAAGTPGALKGLVGSLSTVVENLIAESPSLAKFFPIPAEIASWDLTEGPIVSDIGGYEMTLELVGLLNKPSMLEIEDENKLHLIVDLSIVRAGSDVPFVSTLGISKIDGVWEEFIPSIENFYTYDVISNLGVWFEDFLRCGLIEHRYAPGAFETDSEELFLDDISDDVIVEVLN